MSRLNRAQRRLLRRPRAALEARQRKAEDPFQQARLQVDEAGLAPGRCHRAIDALAERHQELGSKLRREPVIIAYGNRGDKHRMAAAAKAAAAGAPAPSSLPALAEAMRMSRRSAIRAMRDLQAAGIVTCDHGSPPGKEPVIPVLGRADAQGQRRWHHQGRGGAGWANAWYVKGIPTPGPPPPTTPAPPPTPEPDPEPPPRPSSWRELKERFDRDHASRSGKVTRGP